MKRDFKEWLSKFKCSISSYDFYVDFEKVVENVEQLKVELNILNSLIGSKNIESDFAKIIEKYPETLKCIPILIAKREKEIYAQDAEGEFLYNFEKTNSRNRFVLKDKRCVHLWRWFCKIWYISSAGTPLKYNSFLDRESYTTDFKNRENPLNTRDFLGFLPFVL